VLMAGPQGFAMVGSWADRKEPSVTELLGAHFPDADVVVVEGYKEEDLPKVEVHQTGSRAPILCMGQGPSAGPFLALVVDDPGGLERPARLPVLRRDDPGLASALADLVEVEVLGHRKAGAPDP
jgi:hypothetical protein